jgi:hypothetical protein
LPDYVDLAPDIDLREVEWTGHGGKFSGGGATGSWGETYDDGGGSDIVSTASEVPGFDIGEGLILVLLVAVAFSISGSAIYIVYQAPEIMFEAAFEVLLVAKLVRQSKKIESEGWAFSIFRRTWIPFGLVLAMAVIFGFFLKEACPEAISFAEYRSKCWGIHTE